MFRFVLAITLGALVASPVTAAPAAYDDPQSAVDAILDAIEARDRDALIAVFGPESEDVVLTGNAEEDRETWREFLDAYNEAHRIVMDEEERSATLYIGTDQWPFPAPLAEGDDDKWRFDAEAAREEVLTRRIGENELDVIELVRAYRRVQAAYRQIDYDADGVMEFASAILSDPGERNGLYWPDEPGAPESPIGDFVARASAQGYSVNGEPAEPEPYLGYYYRILGKQGAGAPGGARDYMVGNDMVGGHALIAFPSAYGETGIMSFLIGENGLVYQADLGENTLKVASETEAYEPGDPWELVE